MKDLNKLALHDYWEVEPKDALLALLFPAATRGLYEEDQRLAEAFKRAPASTRLSARNQGLGYWLFETTLVYSIFKSWLPIVETEWEAKYPSSARMADLVVSEAGTPRYVFEAKWWMTTLMNDCLREDIEKMRAWPDLAGRFLLTFWRSPRSPANWRSDIDGVLRFCSESGCTLIYVGTFPTDEAATRNATGSYFAVGVIAV